MAIKLDLAFCRRIAVFAAFLHLVSGLHCPIGWDGYGSSCYKVFLQSTLSRGLNWENARRDCLGFGGDLVSIANQSEMNFVSNKSIWNQHYWIGLNDQRNESLFVWSDGTPYNALVYSNWQSGEPNDRAGEDCVELHKTRWNDHGCKEEFGYICEKPKGPSMHVTTVMPPVTSALECPNGWDRYGNSCYMFVIQSSSMRGLNWENARRECLSYGGDLVSIASQSEMDFVYSRSSKVWTQRYWIGLNDRLNESQFVWSDDTPYNASVYSNWHSMEPNNQKDEDCVQLYRTGWNDENCKKKFGYICEKPRGAPRHVTTVMPSSTSGPSNVYRIVVIALSCIVFVLLIAVGLLTWRLTRALMNKRGKTPEGGNSYEVETHETPCDHHVSQGDGYLEPLKVIPPAISHYQSLHSNGVSAKHGNVVSNSGNDNNEDDELYLTIIP